MRDFRAVNHTVTAMTDTHVVTPTTLLNALVEQGLTRLEDVPSLLGSDRHNPTLAALELALVSHHVLGEEALLQVKKDLSGMPVLDDPNIDAAPYLPEQTARSCGAVILERQPLTVALVENTAENIAVMRDALGRDDFEVWLTTASRFETFMHSAYSGGGGKPSRRAADLPTVLDATVTRGASDVHLKVGRPPMLRIDGTLVPLDYQPVTTEWMQFQIDAIVRGHHREQLDTHFTTDMGYMFGNTRFRVNVARDSDGPTIVMRQLPTKIPSFGDISAPDSVRSLMKLERGLILVTGPTGSGKSTTLAAMLDSILKSTSRKVVTLEDPIEFHFTPGRNSLVTQRELGASLYSFADGIRGALRQDPDVILVGEMRDAETIRAALTASETGHLVLASVHTPNVQQTVVRIANSFPADEQSSVRIQMAQNVKGIISQSLLPRVSGDGRVASFEVLLSTPATRTNLRKADGADQLKQTLQTSVADGMTTAERSLARLVVDGIVTREEAEMRAQDVDEFTRQLRRGF